MQIKILKSLLSLTGGYMAQSNNDTLALLGTKELAAKLSVSRSTLWKWVKNGDFPEPIRFVSGRPMGWSLKTVQAWLDKKPTKH